MIFSDPNLGDRVRSASTVAVLREPAFLVLDRVSSIDPADQIRATFLAAVAMALGAGIDPHDEVVRSLRMMSDAEADHTVHVQAIRDYAENELRRFV
jgi:hypothetical protein